MANYEYFFANRPLDSERSHVSQNIAEARERGFPIPPDPNLAVNTTLQSLGLVMYPSLVPDAATYISSRMNDSDDRFPGYNYGTFVANQEGQVAFAKVKYGPDNTEKAMVNGELVDVQVGGLHREAQVLTTLAEHGYEVPAFLGYFTATPKDKSPKPDEAATLETLVIEAIPPDEGSTFPPEYWTPSLARKAASKLRTFAKPVAEIALFQGEERNLSLEILAQRAQVTKEGAYEEAFGSIIDTYRGLEEPIVVHGDTGLTNIIVKYDNSDVLFVDWELSGPGYKGQDAGRTLWGLTLDNEWRFANVNDTARAFVDEWCQSEDDTRSLRFGVVFESLRWIADRQDRLQTQSLDDETRKSVLQHIDAIKAHTLNVLSHIN